MPFERSRPRKISQTRDAPVSPIPALPADHLSLLHEAHRDTQKHRESQTHEGRVGLGCSNNESTAGQYVLPSDLSTATWLDQESMPALSVGD